MADPAAGAAAARGGAGNQGIHEHLVVGINNGNEPRPPMFPLNEPAVTGFLSKVADAGLLTLNIFSATFLLAWGKEGSPCLPKAAKDQPKTRDDGFTFPGWVKVAIIGIPFVIYPATVYISGLVKAAEQGRGRGGLWLAAILCLSELVYGLLIGGVMTFCMSGAQWGWILLVTIALFGLLLLLWGRHFEYPACLRYVMSCACFRRQAAPAPQRDDNDQNNEVAPPPQGNAQTIRLHPKSKKYRLIITMRKRLSIPLSKLPGS